jgi:AMP phosphorylase
MDLVAEEIDIGTHTPTVLLHGRDASELGAHPLDRVRIHTEGLTETGIVEVTDELVEPGRMAVTRPLGHVTGTVSVTLASKPEAVGAIRKKLEGIELEHHEVDRIVRDINDDRLNDVELAAFVTGLYTEGMSRQEVTCLTTCMVDVGHRLDWDQGIVADKHSIGGVAGNRTTPIVVPIVAAAGLTIPKTSSRAVTSAAGTADTMEVFCDVSLDIQDIEEVVARTNGCLAWGGSVDLSPVDDKIIRAETPLSLDPASQLIASVLSKKQAAGSTHVVVDIPYGEGSKVESLPAARELAEDFRQVGQRVGLQVECVITRGSEPIGTGVGPILEARDVLAVLEGEGPPTLREKSLQLAEVLFEGCGVDADARAILDSGRARERFGDIVAAQGGDSGVTREDLRPGDHRATVPAERGGVITHVDNGQVNELARRAGAPKDKGAGIDLAAGVGHEISPGDELLAVYAATESKLDAATTYADAHEPVRVRAPADTVVERQ